MVVREEEKIQLFDKINRRVIHLSGLNANTTMLQSERMLVRSIIMKTNDTAFPTCNIIYKGWVLYIFTAINYLQCGNYGIGGSYWHHVDRSNALADGRAATLIHVLEAPAAGI